MTPDGVGPSFSPELMKQSSKPLLRHLRRGGWTLPEMLIVIAIMAVVAILGITVSRSVRQKSQEVQCVHNLRQLGVAFLAYTAEVNQNVIRSQIGGANIGAGWSRYIVNRGYVAGPTPWKIMHCPSARLPETAHQAMRNYNPASPNKGTGDVWRWYTYGLNMCAITGVTKIYQDFEPNRTTLVKFYELPLAAVKSPSTHVLLADSSGNGPNYWPSQAMQRSDPRGLGLRHGEKGKRYANAFFVDGHIARIDRERSKQLATPEYHYGLNLPQPFVFDVEE